VKASQRDFAAHAPRAARQCRVFYFCGADEAGASAAAARIVALLDNAGERVDMAGADLRRDPVLLADEARSTSLFADARHILVRTSGDEAHDAVANLLSAIDTDEGAPCPVLLVATSATDKSRIAKLLDKRADALVAVFYPPELRDVVGTVRSMAEAAGLRLGGDLAERIARGAGLDVRLAQSEIEKLALYLDASPQSPRTADGEALDAIGAVTEDDGFMPIVNAALSGETGRIAGELRRMEELSLNPVAVLLAFERRAAQLAQIAARHGPRVDARQVIEAEKRARRVFSNDQRDLVQQMPRWPAQKLDRLVQRLTMLHRALLSGGPSANVILAQGVAEIAREANRRR